ncbi:glycosyltransferase [Fulvivirga sp. M361]|uniref:CgeB family protein n=1 Tax=Fulvivirga sp. M361 TaxID=2594266 RepID=UPI0016271062|nr:glycosyltransferase [Fulvivirga sp. M361]
MRATAIREILNKARFRVIDTNAPYHKSNPVFRSIAFRYKTGPLIPKINSYVINNLGDESYDIIWVDKAVYISPKTTDILRSRTKLLIHFTPDPAFTFHKSSLFYLSLPKYDYAITTKSYELDFYHKHLDKDKVYFMYQGYDPQVHQNSVQFKDRDLSIVFIGHAEHERFQMMQTLLNNQFHIRLAGRNWSKFAKKNKHVKHLDFRGEGLYGPGYVSALNNSKYSWGALSKWVPEKHTTRTFEIPACGSALISERTTEIQDIFSDDEVIFYSNLDDLQEKIRWYNTHPDELEKLAGLGYSKVVSAGLDYRSQIEKMFDKIFQ